MEELELEAVTIPIVDSLILRVLIVYPAIRRTKYRLTPENQGKVRKSLMKNRETKNKRCKVQAGTTL